MGRILLSRNILVFRMHFGDPESVIRCLDEQGAMYGVLFPMIDL